MHAAAALVDTLQVLYLSRGPDFLPMVGLLGDLPHCAAVLHYMGIDPTAFVAVTGTIAAGFVLAYSCAEAAIARTLRRHGTTSGGIEPVRRVARLRRRSAAILCAAAVVTLALMVLLLPLATRDPSLNMTRSRNMMAPLRSSSAGTGGSRGPLRKACHDRCVTGRLS